MVTSSSEENCFLVLPNNTEFSTLNQEELRALSTSGIARQIKQPLHFQSAKDSIRRKLTARVTPMTRNDGSDLEKKLNGVCGNSLKRPHDDPGCVASSASVKSSSPSSTAIDGRIPTTVVVKAEKSDVSPCQGGKPWRTVNNGRHQGFGSHSLEPQAKLRRMHSANTLPSTTSYQPITQPTLSCEPRLLGVNIPMLSLLTATQGHLATLQDEDGDTPLHIATAQCQLQLVQHLTQITLTSGISLDIYNKLKQTPLHLAVITNQPLIIKILINAGVDANVPDRNGQTAIHLACQRASIECLMELVNCRHPINWEAKNYSSLTPLHEAVMSNSPDVISFLVGYGANLDSKDGKSGRTPLHYAVELELIPVIQLLINSGANISAASYSGSTPIQSASGRGLHHVTRLLLGNPNETSGRNASSSNNSASSYKTKGMARR